MTDQKPQLSNSSTLRMSLRRLYDCYSASSIDIGLPKEFRFPFTRMVECSVLKKDFIKQTRASVTHIRKKCQRSDSMRTDDSILSSNSVISETEGPCRAL